MIVNSFVLGFELGGRMWAASCLASCCAACACDACRTVVSGISRRSARIAYCGLFGLSLIVSWILREVAAPLMEKIPCKTLNDLISLRACFKGNYKGSSFRFENVGDMLSWEYSLHIGLHRLQIV